ncbi:MAG: hypothetical protein RJB14_603, partial [Pseudomonadota bacterium]
MTVVQRVLVCQKWRKNSPMPPPKEGHTMKLYT